MTLHFGQSLTKDCLEYGNSRMIHAACEYNANGSYITGQQHARGQPPLGVSQQRFLFNSGHPAALRALIRNGQVDPKNYNLKGPQPVYLCDFSDRVVKLVCTLVEYGGNLDATLGPYPKGSLLLHAARLGNVKLVKFLLERGADPDHPEKILSPYKQSKYFWNLSAGTCYSW